MRIYRGLSSDSLLFDIVSRVSLFFLLVADLCLHYLFKAQPLQYTRNLVNSIYGNNQIHKPSPRPLFLMIAGLCDPLLFQPSPLARAWVIQHSIYVHIPGSAKLHKNFECTRLKMELLAKALKDEWLRTVAR
ncbi:hypothetical protein M413DRAFT_404297 [Hebeloma cylindrosporum]|uniref:Uncharacterized protein n=1 Tax=Hebeloma cylindrosporum TaxID=76867 RepID=A0A0C3BTT7_HEBCY|nr:hypothetical protein M413DRAFT_404297 [Hebeloma cylindrosporum h7]